MFGSIILDVAIGMSLIYLLFSLVMTSVTEVISQFTKMRARKLEDGIINILHSKKPITDEEIKKYMISKPPLTYDQVKAEIKKERDDLFKDFYDHPLIYAMYKGDRLKNGKSNYSAYPAYIPAQTFSTVLIDILHKTEDGIKTAKTLRDDLRAQSSPVAQAILSVMDHTETELANVRKSIENWFDASMDRVGGWYKKWTQVVLLIITAVIVIGCNVDTINLTSALMNDKALREGLVVAAQDVAKNASASMIPNASGTLQPEESTKVAQQIQKQIGNLPLPIGWGEYQKEIKVQQNNYLNYIVLKIAGLAITVFAISLGAPFWFDTLSKLINIRNNGRKPGDGGNGGDKGGKSVNIAINTQNGEKSNNPAVSQEYPI